MPFVIAAGLVLLALQDPQPAAREPVMRNAESQGGVLSALIRLQAVQQEFREKKKEAKASLLEELRASHPKEFPALQRLLESPDLRDHQRDRFLTELALYRAGVRIFREELAQDPTYIERVLEACSPESLSRKLPAAIDSRTTLSLSGLLAFAALHTPEVWRKDFVAEGEQLSRNDFLDDLISAVKLPTPGNRGAEESSSLPVLADLVLLATQFPGSHWPWSGHVGFRRKHLEDVTERWQEIVAARQASEAEKREDPYTLVMWYPMTIEVLLQRICEDLQATADADRTHPWGDHRYAAQAAERLQYWQWRWEHERPELWAADLLYDARELVGNMPDLFRITGEPGGRAGYEKFHELLQAMLEAYALRLPPEEALENVLDVIANMDQMDRLWKGDREIAAGLFEGIHSHSASGPLLTVLHRDPSLISDLLKNPSRVALLAMRGIGQAIYYEFTHETLPAKVRDELHRFAISTSDRRTVEFLTFALPVLPPGQAADVLWKMLAEEREIRGQEPHGVSLVLVQYVREHDPDEARLIDLAFECFRRGSIHKLARTDLRAYLERHDPARAALLFDK
ncbi:MAG: hypothetical protein AB1486_00620 [Planctomycetota bacterium]